MAAAIDRDQLVALLQEIVRNDETRYEHHQARRWDGCEPKGGTRWLTPREMARNALRSLGVPLPDPIAELPPPPSHWTDKRCDCGHHAPFHGCDSESLGSCSECPCEGWNAPSVRAVRS